MPPHGFRSAILSIRFVMFKAILPFQIEIQRDISLEHYGLGVVIHPNVRIGHLAVKATEGEDR